MHSRLLVTVLLPFLATAIVPARDVDGQILNRLRRTAENAAESELSRAIDRLVRDAVRCAVGDTGCEERPRAQGKEVIFTDAQGEIITDEKGVPITDPEAAAARAGEGAAGPQRPGEGVWANYDFIPGETVLFYDDYTDDVVGDFPRRMEFQSGNWEVVEWEGRRLLRNTGPRYAAVKVILPRALPERFTIEFDAYFTHSNYQLVVGTAAPASGSLWNGFHDHLFLVGVTGTGVETRQAGARRSVTPAMEVGEGLVPVRILVDGTYAKVYVAEKRVANIPNAEFPRTDELWLENVYHASHEAPMYIGPVRVAEGGTDLYRRLVEEGRVATQGILFAVNSATIQPESTPTLVEIGTMLKDHPELRLRIEGHTDSTGDDAANLDLSRRRAEAVRDFLVARYGIDGGRLETEGMGETNPVADNATPEGRQNNRRVELVRMGE
jgi:OmpA-OmpF porin, OOP family